MTLKAHIIIMTAFAVVSDAILIPFYPQFFQLRYGMDSSVHVGAYVAAISIAVMCTLPLWARVARRVEPLHLLVWTQLAAGTFSVLSNWAPDVVWYWVLSMLMFMCKSSYLLMYPYLMRLTPKETHASVVGILSVVVHFGAIFGAVVGGFVLQTWGTTGSIMAMAAGDFFQMAVCVHLIRSGKIVRVSQRADTLAAPAAPALPLMAAWRARLPILRLALVMLVFDFGCFVIRPFFSVHWQAISSHASELASGAVFAIPGVLAIIALRVHAWIRKRSGKLPDHTLGNLLLGVAGLLMQAAPDPTLVVVGRCIYGWAIFQIIVKLEVNLFRLSTPDRYAQDYAVTNFFQNLGVLLSSFAAGAIVSRFGLYMPFLVGAAAFVLTALLDRLILKVPSAAHSDPDTRAASTPDLEASPHAS
ncbi:MFS transporter [Bordetella petrii]|uniref:MFS transporter n=1 Tax=Bordetella petrii TaxID=94624 RepID=UPI001E4AE496|nr:MFS transporter [Bordetella petrii]MCD0504059.1 MFS transporter [Bordetella petrii]